ncbi:MAG: hypothetical protein ACI81R_002578 [Bradymonadia bacterium]
MTYTLFNEQVPMETTPGGWTIIDRDAGVLALTYRVAGAGRSTCFAARMPNGEMLIVSPAVGLGDVAASELERFGPVGALVANNGFHHLGQAAWRTRYPQARTFAPAEAMARIAKKSEVKLAFEPLDALRPLLGDSLGVREVPNTKCGECWFWVHTSNGWAWYLSDVLANMPRLPKPLPLRLLFSLSKSAPGYRVFNLAMKFVVKDKKATLRLLREDLLARPPQVMVPAHGDLLIGDDLFERTNALLNGYL